MSSAGQLRQVSRTSCDTCRKLKIRCVKREDDVCMRCFEKGETCFTTPMPKREAKPKRRERLEEIEERIQRMESILTSSNLDTASATTPQSVSTDTCVEDQMASLFLSDKETSVFIGPSAGMSLFSPRGLEWLASKTGSSELTKLIGNRLEEIPSAAKASIIWQNKMMDQRVAFPQKDIMDAMIDTFFNELNAHVPIFSEEYIRPLYTQTPYPEPEQNPALYASISIILTLVCIVSDLCVPADLGTLISDYSLKGDKSRAMGYLANCWSVYTQLCFSRGDILTVQALTGMGLALEVLLDPEASHITLGAAIRIAISLGLHRKVEIKSDAAFDSHQRQMIFWLLYRWDKSLSLRLGRPPYIRDDDIEVDEPEEDDLIRRNTKQDLVTFLHNIKLGRISYRIYINLYSARSRKQSPQEYDKAVAQLDRELVEWCEALPVEKRPSKNFAQTRDLPTQMVLFLHLDYYNCMSMVHRARYYQGITLSREAQNNCILQETSGYPSSQIYDGHLRCIDAARRTAQLFATIVESYQSPHVNIICHLAFYPLSAYLVIFTNLINNPHDSYVNEDLALLRSIMTCLASPLVESGSPIGGLIASAYAALQSIAERYIARGRKDGWVNKKRRHLDEDAEPSVADMISQPETKEPPIHQAVDQREANTLDRSNSNTRRDMSNVPASSPDSSSSPGNTGPANSTASGTHDSIPLFMPFVPWTLDWEFNHLGYNNDPNFSAQAPGNDDSFWPGNTNDQFASDPFNYGFPQ